MCSRGVMMMVKPRKRVVHFTYRKGILSKCGPMVTARVLKKSNAYQKTAKELTNAWRGKAAKERRTDGGGSPTDFVRDAHSEQTHLKILLLLMDGWGKGGTVGGMDCLCI